MAKVLVSVDDQLLKRIDRRARQLGMTRSAFLAQAAADRLAAESRAGASPRARAALATMRRLCAEAGVSGDSTDSTDFIRAARDAR